MTGSEFAEANLRLLIEFTSDRIVSNRDWATFLLSQADVDRTEVRAALRLRLEDSNEVVQVTSAETLREAMALAYSSNPQLDAERARLRATDEGVPQAKSGFRPRAAVNADAGRQMIITKPGASGDGTGQTWGYSVTAEQSLFSGYRTTNGVRQAEAEVRSGRENLRNVEQQILLAAVTAYADVLRDQALVRLRESNVSVLTKDLQAAEARRAVREVTRTDVAQAWRTSLAR